jgi:transcriptional regulator with XRE-family HTH domain
MRMVRETASRSLTSILIKQLWWSMPNKARRVEFGKWLKARREAMQLTQMDLARLLSYDNPQIISNIERGFSALPAKRISDFAKHLSCGSLELEVRRMWAATKDETSASALQQVLAYLPILEIAMQEQISSETILQAVRSLSGG